VLGLAGLASLFLYAVFHIPHVRNEYKFAMSAALCLAPFAPLALQPLVRRAGRGGPWLAAGVVLALAAPAAVRLGDWPWASERRPRLVLSDLSLRLAASEPGAALTDAIRERTPANAVLVVETEDLHLPTLTRRQLWVAPASDEILPGKGQRNDQLLRNVRGYPRALLRERRALVGELFESGDGARRERALARMLELGRPLAIAVERAGRAELADWLAGPARARVLYEDEATLLFGIEPAPLTP
jgi:hypothetical protein